MLLSPQEADQFFKLHRSLMCYVNERLQVVPNIDSPKEFSALPPDARMKVRNAFLEELDLIESFADANPFDLTDDEIDIVLSWRHQVSGKFVVFRYLKKYTVFLTTNDAPVAYGVVALTEPFEDLIGPYLPVLTETMLLPFHDKIIYDGLMGSYNISFGGGIKRGLNDSYRTAKQRLGIVTSLPIEQHAMIKNTTHKAAKRKPRNPFQGRWLIESMTEWDDDFINAEERGYFEFKPKGLGSFHFGYVHGFTDYCVVERDGLPAVEFSWEGRDEMDAAMGRGWAVLDGDRLTGKLLFHRGDASGFVACKE